MDRLGIPEEELARQQQQLFDEARQQQMEVSGPSNISVPIIQRGCIYAVISMSLEFVGSII